MSLQERIYSVLVVSASESFNTALSSILTGSRYSPVPIANDVSTAKRILAEHDFDFVIINAPLPDDNGVRLAIDAGSRQGTVPLLIIRAEHHDEIHDRVAEHGVFTLSRPLSKQTMLNALSWMATARERLRRNEKKTLTLEEKMEEIRLVNRAKWLLISERKMEEAEAHRFIEKQAMDHCISRKAVAEEIIHKLKIP